jgi:hypothetical protein
MNQYRCETCKIGVRDCPVTKGYYDGTGMNIPLRHYQKDFTSIVGCASHSDFQSEQLTENQKNTRLLSKAAHDYKIRRDERDKVLESIEQLRYGIIAELTTGYEEADTINSEIVTGCFNKFIAELRQQAGEP